MIDMYAVLSSLQHFGPFILTVDAFVVFLSPWRLDVYPAECYARNRMVGLDKLSENIRWRHSYFRPARHSYDLPRPIANLVEQLD